jgi:hypothetical protein
VENYQERETLAQVIAVWEAESPVPADVHQHVLAELDRVGLTDISRQDDQALECG